MPTLPQALYTALSGDVLLIARLGTRIFPGAAPSGTPLPYVTFQRRGVDSHYYTGGPSGTLTTEVQLTCWALSALEAQQIAALLRDAVDGLPAVWDGLEVDGVFVTDEVDGVDAPMDGSARMLHFVTLCLECWHAADVPALDLPGYWDPGTTPLPALAAPVPSLHRALYARLSTWAPLTALVGTRLYPSVAPSETVFPYVTVQRREVASYFHFGGASATLCTEIQLDCWALRPIEAQQVARVLRFAIEGSPAVWDGLEVDGVFVSEEVDLAEAAEDGSERIYYRVVLVLECWHARNVPAGTAP